MAGIFGNGTRRAGGSISRFGTTANHAPHADRFQAALRADHPALSDNRTLFRKSVVDAADAPRLLISGYNQAKIGTRIQKGAWAGLPVFCLTLEERATCPSSCHLLAECYGNSLPMARRHRAGDDLVRKLNSELRALMRQNPGGIAVRLHILGDFYSAAYVRCWFIWMAQYRRLHVWGYTAHQAGTEIGALVLGANSTWPDRWRVRCSVPPTVAGAPLQATTIWRQPEAANVAEGLVCPVSTHKTAACVTCGLCWSQAADAKRIVFIGHGMRRRAGPRSGPTNFVEAQIALAGGSRAVASGMRIGVETVIRWGKTAYVPEGVRPAFDQLCSDLAQRGSGAASS